MFRLYGNIEGWKKIDISLDEKDIIDSMVGFSDKFNFYDYLIIKRENDGDVPYKRVRSVEDFEEYLEEYKQRVTPLDDMSCVDLKRMIIDGTDGRKR